MQFTINTVSVCTGGENHIEMAMTVQGQPGILKCMREDFTDDIGTVEERIKQRVRSAVLESGAVTKLQIKAALEGKTFKA